MDKNKSIEILAPSGSYESLEAAVRQGADAVYIGSLQFSARAYAANFDSEQLKKAVRYCRLHGVKIHMAINTLISDSEMSAALNTAKEAYELGVDAFIIQDLGLAALIKKSCPEIALHASTQMGVHTPGAAKLLYSLGFERVVLAREMNRDEIKEVADSCPIETEVFVHGALCMCMSGQCYLSAMIGGRSGNRGRCAQPCRLPFKVPNGTGHDLSLKDNCIIDELSKLSEMGVTSAKIEGRMKRPEYVGAAAAACRHSADCGHADSAEIEQLRAVFSRIGFTNGYYCGKLGRRKRKDFLPLS
ncbi:MAG: U32 family peptidase, partial [Clostridia bacterium]|nr:U32 family peptidase [Clostridia bacterium]